MTGLLYTQHVIHSLHLSFQAHIMGVRKIVVLAHEWEPYYKDEFRRAARLARELSIAIEPIFEDKDPRFAVNSYYDRTLTKNSPRHGPIQNG